MCPQLAQLMSLWNVSMSLGTCAGHNYSTTCVSSAFTQRATPTYYNCKESMIDSSHSEENKYAMVYYSSDDYDCALGDPETIRVVATVTGVTETNKNSTCDAFAAAVNGMVTYCSLTDSNTDHRRMLASSNLYMDITVADADEATAAMNAENFIANSVTLPTGVTASTLTAETITTSILIGDTGYGHECVGYNAVDGDFDESDHMPDGSVAECASRCIGDCTAFSWDRPSGCTFFTGAVMRQALPIPSSNQDNRGCFQRFPDLQEICSWSSDAPDAGEGWIVECGKLCHVSDSRAGPARLEWDAPWRMGGTIKECGDLCKSTADCEAFHYNPQNGGSCQLLPGFIVGTETDSIPTYIGGACVHKGIRENTQDSGSSALTLSFFALTMLLFFA